MKKKIYFIISSICQIIVSIVSIIMSNDISKQMADSIIEQGALLGNSSRIEQIISLYTNYGTLIVFLGAILGIIVSLYILNVAIKNEVLKKKGLLAFLSLVCFFFASSGIVQMLSIINTIVLLLLKRKNPEDYPEKNEIPKLEYQKATKKEIIWSIILIVLYLSQLVWGNFIPDDISLEIALCIDGIWNLVVFVLSIIIFKDKLKKDIKLFKENMKSYFRYMLLKFVIGYIMFFLVSIICTIVINQGEISKNQQMIEILPLWYVIPLSVIVAPILEELVFRGVFRRIIKNNKIFIIVTALIFGLMHVIGEGNLIGLMTMIWPYTVLGGYLAYIYAKTENISTNILSHMIWNTVATIMMVVLTLGK